MTLPATLTITKQPTAGNIVRAYRNATVAQRQAGFRWYRDAHGAAASLDPLNPDRAAGIIAALSPQTNWSRNLELASRAYDAGTATGTLGRSCRQANEILAGAAPLDVLTGPKTRAFYQCITDPDGSDAVCIDRHAIDIAVGERLTDFDRNSQYPLRRNGWYATFEQAYRDAAATINIPPLWLQAATWVAHTEKWSGVRTA